MNKFYLTDSFLDRYKHKTAPFGFNGFGELVYLRTYSRIKENGENERWWETVKRVVEGTYNIQKRWIEAHNLGWNSHKAQLSAQEMYDKIFNMKFLPPGRGLWAMGSSIIEDKKLYAALNNCFSCEQELITDKGAVKFKDLPLNEFVNVLTKNGEFSPAKVSSFGKQDVNKIILKPLQYRSNLELNIEATANHRWILENDVETTELKVGDKIKTTVNININKDSTCYKTGFAHGLIFGDGTRHTYYPERHFIKVCDGNAEYYNTILSQVDGYKGITYGSKDNYPVITIIRKNENWKDLPYHKNPNYYAGFICGWLQADSWLKPSGSICLDTQNEIAAQWLIKNAPIAGYIPVGISYLTEDTNFGARKNRLNRITLTSKNILFEVKKIEALSNQEVFCVTEYKTHSFSLAGGILTGNCAFTSTETINEDYSKPFCFLMDMSMLGVGVGFDVKGAGKITVKGVNNKREKQVIKISDDREGWVDSVRILIDSYFFNMPAVEFDYSLIRPSGQPIKGFGGVSSGAEPLKECHAMIRKILEKNSGSPITITTIVDVMNVIGKCVVSGNVRRSAEIVFGSPSDEEYLKLKDYRWDNSKKKYVGSRAERADYGWTSNNSIFAELGMDYSVVGKQTAENGEPGYIWMENAKNHSRMNNGPDYKDARASGANPCNEQTLESYEMCCLVETFPANHASLDEYLKTLKYAYLYAKTVTLGETHWPETNRVMLRNRRIGCSMSGIVQAIAKFGINEFKNWCEQGYKKLEAYDEVYSDWFAIPKSIKKTSVKPSGTVSLLVGATPGIHFPEAKYYIRRIRLAKDSEQIGRAHV